jgi:hypothetical protein
VAALRVSRSMRLRAPLTRLWPSGTEVGHRDTDSSDVGAVVISYNAEFAWRGAEAATAGTTSVLRLRNRATAIQILS